MKRSYTYAIATLFLMAAAVIVDAQEKTAMTADQTLRSNAHVNPSTLGMELTIPLAAYPGRGKGGVSVALNYSSKVWRMGYLGSFFFQPEQCRERSHPRYGELSSSGWTTDAAVPYIEYTGMDNIYDDAGNSFPSSVCGEYEGTVGYVKRITVHLPGGGTHELRASDSVNYLSSESMSEAQDQTNWDTTFYAVDGSNLIYEQDTTGSKYRLLLTDGSTIDFDEDTESLNTNFVFRTIRKATVITDANGSKTNYHAADEYHPNGYITDTMGRTIDIPLALSAPESAGTQTYSVPGGLTYYLHWQALSNAQTNPEDEDCFGEDPQCGPDFHNANGHYVVWEQSEFDPVVLTQIDIPNGTSFTFSYDMYGLIDKIEYPAGASETFEYTVIPMLDPAVAFGDEVSGQTNFGVSERHLKESAGADALTWTYGVSKTTGPDTYKVTVTAPDETSTESMIDQGWDGGGFGFASVLAGGAYEQSFLDQNEDLISKTVTTYAVDGTTYQPQRNPRVTKVESITCDPAESTCLSSSVTTSYASLSNYSDPLLPVTVNQYGYSTTIGSLGTLQRTTETDYLSDSNYDERNLRSLPSEIRVKDSGGSVKAKTQIGYDEIGSYPLLTDYTSVTSGQWANPSTNYRGLVTTTKSWTDISGNQYVQTHAQYDLMGNLRKSWDANGNLSQIEYSSTYDRAYPTKTISPVPDAYGTYGSDEELETTTTYDYDTGLTTSVTDPNDALTEMEYDDPLLRPTKVTTASGTAIEAEAITEYGAGTSPTTRWVKVKSQIDDTHWKEAYTWYDGLGRTIRSQSVDDDGDVSALTCYDHMGRVSKVTNPFRDWDDEDCDSTLEWTTSTYDDLGRVTSVTTPDSAVVSTDYSLATAGSEIGTVVTVEDQAGKTRRSITNALGQLIRVDEPNSSNQLGDIDDPNQDTLYAYDKLNNLTTVTQGAQTRTFTYDALSRLTTAANPESGTISYGYDSNGNLTSKTDARGYVTNYTYDTLNRVLTRAYATPTPTASPTPAPYQDTPTVSYYYDLLSNAKGKLIKVTSSVSTTEYTEFDILGRVKAHKQTTDGVEYQTDYTYNLGGALIEETYPSGRTVSNVLDGNGDLSVVRSAKCLDSTPGVNTGCTSQAGVWNYASSFSYNAAGAVTSMQLGNGRWESTTFNSRLQPTTIALGTVNGGSDKLKLEYGYGTTANNGNVLSQSITVKRSGLSDLVFDQTYTYDSLNRIKTATEMTGETENWKQTFQFDRYGNRNFDTTTGATTTLPESFDPDIYNPTFNAANNRMATGQGWTYDAAGNVIVDPEGRSFFYDGENKQVEVRDAYSATVGEYYFDGDGKRVKKVVPSTGEVTVFVYDASGKQIAEYSTIVADTNDAKVQYLTNDHLGSPRIKTDADGDISSRTDYMPYGEEIIALGGRSSDDDYVGDDVRQGFTGYERDGESDLDFAQARYYAKNHGRFNSPDPARMLGARIVDPQNWNLYVYARNNPLILVDITGEFPTFSFSLHVRAFAPFDWFGPGRIAKGDNRGFSTAPDATYRISSFTQITADGSDNMKYSLATTFRDPPTTSTTDIGVYSWSAQSPSHLSDRFGDIQSDDGIGQPSDSLSYDNYGNDRAIPGSSDIDLHSNFKWNYQEQKDGSVNLTISGTVTGDQFPAAEAFIRDSKGNGVFLGVFATPPGSSPVTSLPGNNRLPMINANVTVQVRNGVFTGVIENGKVVSLDDYNKRFTDQPAAQ